MIQLITGVKGTGKTKTLIRLANRAAETTNGHVVCIEHTLKLTYDISHRVRLIDSTEYGISGYTALYGFVCGILAQDYDVTDLFIDSVLKIGGSDLQDLYKLVAALEPVVEKARVRLTITVSADTACMGEVFSKYLYREE